MTTREYDPDPLDTPAWGARATDIADVVMQKFVPILHDELQQKGRNCHRNTKTLTLSQKKYCF